jgi:hypothetical protein
LPPSWPVEVFDLTPLTDEQTDALISALDPGLTADARAVVAGRCDGVPFYIEQVVAGLSETGVPEALYEPLFARLRASPRVVPVVEAAAVIGRQVDRALLCSVVDLTSTTSTTSLRNSRMRWCSSRGDPTVGDSATSCCARSQWNWRPNRAARAARQGLPTP